MRRRNEAPSTFHTAFAVCPRPLWGSRLGTGADHSSGAGFPRRGRGGGANLDADDRPNGERAEEAQDAAAEKGPGMTLSKAVLSLDKTKPHDWEPAGTLRWDADLTDTADFFGCDKGTLDHNYTPHYERQLAHLKSEPINLLEIGVACGASLKMWSRFFPYAKVTGVDIRPECEALCSGYPNVRIVIADATRQVVAGEYDVIIDDGSHLPGHIVKTFSLYWPKLKPGGFYFIEDLRCTHSFNYLTYSKIPAAESDKDRGALVALIDALLRNCDNDLDVESVQFWRELMVVTKKKTANG
jgi:hypothetical protein